MKYQKYLKYPHLGPEDAIIWDRFILKYPNFFKSVDYDVRVGKGRNYKLFPDKVIREDLEYLSKKRIDVLGYIGNEIYVIELKPKATFSAIGQALGLAVLLEDQIKPGYILKPCIITDAEIPDTLRICKTAGVLHFVV